MEEDFFLKNMKDVKPFKKDAQIVKTKTTSKIPIQIIGTICRFRGSNFSQPVVLPFLQTP